MATQTRRRADTRGQIQRAALRRFTTQGYDATSLREIAEDLGVTKAAVYYHFPTKDDILESLLSDLAASLDELTTWARAEPSTRERRIELLHRLAVATRGSLGPLMRCAQQNELALAAISTLLTLVIAFLFAAVSAWAIAMISITPISGMTLTTLIVTAVALSAMGLHGESGMLQTLLIGGVVCTALSMAGSLVTLFKIGYWTGATPRRIQVSVAAGSILAAVAVTAAIVLFAHTNGFVADAAHPNPMPAPQANAMAAVIQSVMASAEAPWFLFGIGAVIAVLVALTGVSPLAFALGMYLPMDLNTPLLLGAVLAWFVRRPSGDETLDRARANRGTLIASGLIAGGALAGVLDALVKALREWLGAPAGESSPAYLDGAGNWVGLLAFFALAAFVCVDARRAKASEGAGPAIQM